MLAAAVVVPLSAFVPLSGAVIASGRLVSASSVKKVQHPIGGVISEILVEDGEKVGRGDVVARFDVKQAASNLAMLAAELTEVRVREARLAAERDHSSKPQWPHSAPAGMADTAAEAAEETQGALFVARELEQQASFAVLDKQLEELHNQVRGLRAELVSKSQQAKIVEAELGELERLFEQRLVTLSRISTQRREAAALSGDVKQLQAQISETGAKISGVKLQIARLRQTSAGSVLEELAEVREKRLSLTQQHAAALEVLERLEIRAPQSGIVHDLAVHTIGGVIGPGEVLMLISPSTDGLVIELKLQTKDVEQVYVGQPAEIVMPALDRAATPQLHGEVIYVSPDVIRDPQLNSSHYTVRVELRGDSTPDLHLVAGMPVEAFLATNSRSIASYLLKPLADQLLRMFRER